MWPLPSTLLLSRYGPFAGPVVLPLRPLTLLFGANGTGKSALVRLPALLAWLGQDKSGESHLTAVDLDERGHLGAGWPRTAFTTDLRLAQTLLQMQWEREGQDRC